MSYDLSIAVKVEDCGKYATISEPLYCNPTYNLRDMFVACMDWDYKQGEYYRCSEIISNIERGIDELIADPKYEKYNSPNGWGSVESALEALISLRECIYENAEEIPIECLYMRW